MEMRLRAPVTRGYFFLLGALRLVNAASPQNIDQKKISSGIQGVLYGNGNSRHKIRTSKGGQRVVQLCLIL